MAYKFVKYAEKVDSNDIINQGMGGRILDYTLAPWMSSRAGKAETLAKATGTKKEDIPFSVRHPMSSSALAILTGSALGAAGGALGGEFIPGNIDPNASNPGLGAAVGAELGMFGGAAALTHHRRKKIREIIEAYNKTPESALDMEKAKPDAYNFAKNLLLPLSSTDRAGQLDAYNKLKKRPAEGYSTAANISQLIPYLQYPLGSLNNFAQSRNINRLHNHR